MDLTRATRLRLACQAAVAPARPGPLRLSRRDELRRAAAALLDILAFRHAGVSPPAELGDLQAHLKVLFLAVPSLADGLLDMPPPAGDVQATLADLGEGPGIEVAQPDLLLGTSGTALQHGLLGRTVGPDGSSTSPLSEPVHFDTAGCEFVVISGNTGTGKSSTLAVLIENAVLHMRGLNALRRPLCVVILVLHSDNHDLLAARSPNSDPQAVSRLLTLHHALPQGIATLRRLVLPDLLDESRAAFPELPTDPMVFSPGQLGASGWELLLGLAEHRGTDYAQQVFGVLSRLREGITLARLREALAGRRMMAPVRARFEERLELCGRFIRDDAAPAPDLVQPGAVLVVEVRDHWLKDEQRATLAAVLMDQLVRQAKKRGVHLMLCLDEGHHALKSKLLLDHLEPVIKQRRHLGVTPVIADLDLRRLPVSMLSQASLMIVHESTSEAGLRHLTRAHPLWGRINPLWLARQRKGRAYVLATGGMLATGMEHFLDQPRLLDIRDRVSQHGGHTRLATS